MGCLNRADYNAVVMVLLVALLFGVIGISGVAWQDHKVRQLQDVVAGLEERITTLEEQNRDHR